MTSMSEADSSPGLSTPRLGRSAPRSKTGCSTCRARKLKCDEAQPVCQRCESARVRCEWLGPVPHPKKKPLIQGFGAAPKATVSRKRAVPLMPSRSSVTHNASSSHPATFETQPPNTNLLAVEDLSTILQLSAEDLESFEYIPRSQMVLRFGKPWRWSMLSYVHSRIAPKEPGVMRAFTAVASMELRCREIVGRQGKRQSFAKNQAFKTNASQSLHLAMQDLSEVLNRLAVQPNDHDNLEALFSMWFLILHFGIYDADLVQTSFMHLDGIRTFISEWFHGFQPRIFSLPPAAKQLLVFICYLDGMLALGGMGGGRLSMDLLNVPVQSPVHYDALFEQARVCVPQLWGGDYPTDELIDDIENYRPLRLIHSCQKLKLRVWRLGLAAAGGNMDELNREAVWGEIEQLGEEFYDLQLLARSLNSTEGRRMIWTVYHACMDFYGLKILYSCIQGSDFRPAWLEAAIADMLNIGYKSLAEDQDHVYRYAWPLRVALFRATDPIHREWLQAQVKKASVLLSNLGIPTTPLENDAASGTIFVEYNYFQST